MGELTDLDAIPDALCIPRASAHDGALAVNPPIDGNAIAAVAADDPESARRKVEVAAGKILLVGSAAPPGH